MHGGDLVKHPGYAAGGVADGLGVPRAAANCRSPSEENKPVFAMVVSAAPSPTDGGASSDSVGCAAGTTPGGGFEPNGPTELIVSSR
jgi:hypothetical protein